MQESTLDARESKPTVTLPQWNLPPKARQAKLSPVLHSLLRNKIGALGLLIVLAMILIWRLLDLFKKKGRWTEESEHDLSTEVA